VLTKPTRAERITAPKQRGCVDTHVVAFSRTCKGFDLPMAIERSQSGNGAHVWFFFEAPLQASLARKPGCLPGAWPGHMTSIVDDDILHPERLARLWSTHEAGSSARDLTYLWVSDADARILRKPARHVD
jgi:hypothetical protein